MGAPRAPCLAAERIDHFAAAGCRVGSAERQGVAEDLLEVAEFTHAGADFLEARFDQALDSMARGRSEKLPDIVECEPGGLGTADEAQPAEVLVRVEAVVGRRAATRAEKARALIIADRRSRDPRRLG